jgi:cobalt/nickel transport protein
MKRKNLMLILICIFIVGAGLIFGTGKEFSGADTQAEDAILELNADYKPWFDSLWEPPSGEIESLLFALQAAAGAGFIGYYVGRKKNVSDSSSIRKVQ